MPLTLVRRGRIQMALKLLFSCSFWKGSNYAMRKELESTARKEVQEPDRSHVSGSLNEAIKAVYQRYGTDLPTFFRDAYKEAARRHKEPADSNTEAVPL